VATVAEFARSPTHVSNMHLTTSINVTEVTYALVAVSVHCWSVPDRRVSGTDSSRRIHRFQVLLDSCLVLEATPNLSHYDNLDRDRRAKDQKLALRARAV